VSPKRIEKIPPKYRKAVEASLLEVSKRIQKQREALKLTQEALAEKLNLSPTMIQSIEQGRRYPSLPTLFYVCQFLGIEINISK